MWSVAKMKCKLAYYLHFIICINVKCTPIKEYTEGLPFFFSYMFHFLLGTFGTLASQQTSLFGGNALGG